MFGPREIIIIGIIVLILFGGRGKIPSLMGDIAKGINSFKKGLKEDTEAKEEAKVDEAIDVTPPKEKTK